MHVVVRERDLQTVGSNQRSYTVRTQHGRSLDRRVLQVLAQEGCGERPFQRRRNLGDIA